MRSASAVVLRPLQFLVWFLSGLVPRRPGRWAFGCWSGHRFGDNAGAVFLHLAENPVAGVEAAWITIDRDIRDRLRADGHRAFLAWSPRGAWWTVRSGVFVYDSLPKDVNYWLSRGARLVLLRHGIGIKQIERAIQAPDHRLHKLFHGTAPQRAIWSVLLPWHRRSPDLLMACSPLHASQGQWFFGTDPDHIRITGFPRHDRFATAVVPDRSSIPTVGRTIPPDRPLYLYLPTFREGLGRQSFDWDALAAAAEAADVTIAVKLHYVDADRGVLGADTLDRAAHLRMVDPHLDPTEAYPHADGMITDFSSAPFDFMLFDRPIIYYVPDAESFVRRRPLTLALDDVAVGARCRDGAELREALIRATTDGIGEYRERHDAIRRRFHTFAPGGAAARVVHEVCDEFVSRSPGASLRLPATVRPAGVNDIDAVVTHNNDAVPAVNELSRAEVAWFLEHAQSFLVIDAPDGTLAGFLIGLAGPGLPYDSLNYAWFSTRYPRFVYVDRVVVAPGGRGQGVGSTLYDAFARRGRADGFPVMLAEVNIRPRNEASLRFHDRHDFAVVGEQDTEGGSKRVVMLERRLDD